jgi:predicted component of type VI protein secretion system
MPGLRHSTPQGVKILPLRETFTMGRDAGNDLALSDDPMVSYQHACIRQVGDTYVVEDLQSTNGTFLERALKVRRITSPRQLRPNDVIRVGSTHLVFDLDVATDTPPVTPPAAEPGALSLGPEEPDMATEVLGETREGRYLPVFMEPPEESAPPPSGGSQDSSSPQPAPPTLQEAAQRIAELEQQLAELKAQLAKKQG